MSLKDKNISLLISGSIAAYKTPELLRLLIKEGANVRAVMSQAAENFVTKLTLQTVTKNKVFTNMFDLTEEIEIGHISLPDNSDVLLVAPATADIIAKAAYGIADDLLSTIILASTKPILFCPAMNTNMWHAQITQENVSRLKNRGYYFVNPSEGELACGWVGQGRMAELHDIIESTNRVVSNEIAEETQKILGNSKVIITAGPTREMIDPIRFISNKSSGKMGYAIASASKQMGAKEVILISGPTSLPDPVSITTKRVESASEMEKLLLSELEIDTSTKNVIVFMASAVSDHKPKNFSNKKLKYNKTENTTLDLVINPDIICNIAKDRTVFKERVGAPLYIVGFAAETGTEEELINFAKKKLIEKNLDLIVANFSDENMGTDSGTVWVISKDGSIKKLGPKPKQELSFDIVNYCLQSLH